MQDGHSNWTLPTIQQLISLITGCRSSGCGVTDPGCLAVSVCLNDPDCVGCNGGAGPGPGGCYWPAVLGSSCQTSFWSRSRCSDTNTCVWAVDFSNGYVFAALYDTLAAVRCVRPR